MAKLSDKICVMCKTARAEIRQPYCPKCRAKKRREYYDYKGNPEGWEYVQKLAREWQAAKEKTEKVKAKMGVNDAGNRAKCF